MTNTDSTTPAEDQLDAGQHETIDDTADTFLDYAAREYTDLAERAPRMPMDVQIAATIGAGYEARALRDGVQLLTTVIQGLERVLADHTATMRAFLASQQQNGKFGLEEAEDTQRAAEDAAAQQQAAGG